jgi:hypothetical protein
MITAEYYSTPSMQLALHGNGILEMGVPNTWTEPDTVDTAMENVALLYKVLEGKRCAILVKPPDNHLTREVLACYREVGNQSTATALLTKSFGARIVGNVYLKLMRMTASSKRPKRPIKLFKSKEQATEWLLYCLKEQNSSAEVYQLTQQK